MKKIRFYSALVVLLSMALGACSESEELAGGQLSVSEFYPTIVADGTEVIITGRALAEVNEVVFPGGKPAASLRMQADGTLVAVAPEGVSDQEDVLILRTADKEVTSRQTIRKANPRLNHFYPVEGKTFANLSIVGNDFLLVDKMVIGGGEKSLTIEAMDFIRKSNTEVKVALPQDTPLGDEVPVSIILKSGQSISMGVIKIVKGGGAWVEKEIALPTGTALPLAMGSWSGNTKVEPGEFAQFKVGDVLRAYVSNKEGDWSQIGLRNGSNWGGLIPAWEALAIADENFAAGFIDVTLDEVVMAQLLKDGLIVTGCNYTLNKVAVITLVWEEAGSGGPAETELYTGDPIVMGGWSGNTKVEADAFADAQVGDFIRVYIADAADSYQQGSIKNGATWEGMNEAVGVIALTAEDFEAGYYQVAIDEGILNQLLASGLIVSGANYTATKITLVEGK